MPDFSEDIINRLNAVENEEMSADPVIIGEDGKIVNREEDDAGGGDGDDFKPTAPWDYIKSKLPEAERETFKIPEGITKDNEMELFDIELKKFYTPEETNLNLEKIHPLAKEIIEKSAADESFNPEEWVKSKVATVNLTNASENDLLKVKYSREIGIKSDENPNGMTEEEMLAGINALNPLEKRKLSNEEREFQQKQVQQSFNYQEDPGAKQKRITDYNKGINEFANEFFSDKREKPELNRTIAGVDIGEANFQAFKEKFVSDFSISDKGKAAIVDKLLNNDAALAKAALFLENENVISQTLTKKFNEGKNFVLDKLNLTGNASEGDFGKGEGMSEEEKRNRLNSPDGRY